MRHVVIYQNFNLSSSNGASILRNKLKVLEVANKICPLLSAIIRKRYGLTAELENILTELRDKIPCPLFLSLGEIQIKALYISVVYTFLFRQHNE
jgi:hypothetical protein